MYKILTIIFLMFAMSMISTLSVAGVVGGDRQKVQNQRAYSSGNNKCVSSRGGNRDTRGGRGVTDAALSAFDYNFSRSVDIHKRLVADGVVLPSKTSAAACLDGLLQLKDLLAIEIKGFSLGFLNGLLEKLFSKACQMVVNTIKGEIDSVINMATNNLPSYFQNPFISVDIDANSVNISPRYDLGGSINQWGNEIINQDMKRLF